MSQHDYAGPLQIDTAGQLRHLLSIAGLPRPMLLKILDKAKQFLTASNTIKSDKTLLKDRTVVNLFYESSTRTRSTFDLAAKNLGANILNLNITTSSTHKGESLLDTINNLKAMGGDLFVIRHPAAGTAQWLAQHVNRTFAVINAGDGCHEHPTQALLDMFTISRYKKDFSKICVTIVGDILHSRVARSQIHALTILGVPQIRVVAPKTLLPADAESLGVTVYNELEPALVNADVIVSLRLQTERMQSGRLSGREEYHRYYGLTQGRLKLAKPDALVMHPGPINRGVEIDSLVADGAQAVILEQVHYGIAVRMAVMALLLNPDK